MIRNAIAKMVEGRDLQEAEMTAVMGKIMDGEGTDAQIGAFMTALRMKGETIDEVTGAARAMRRRAVRVDARSLLIVDTCGTGGDGRGTFNISTTTAFVVAAAGIVVAKHGNRAVSSGCGSADLLEALGVNIDAGIETVEACLQEIGIGFLFAPRLHPAMKYVQPIRKSLDFQTAFNILGPLANPAGAQAQVMGVADESLMGRIAETLRMLGLKRAMVVHSNGLDEISTMGPTKLLHLREDGTLVPEDLHPELFGIRQADFNDLSGGDAETNAVLVREVINGKSRGPRKDIVVLNAAAAIIVAGLAEDFAEGIERADAAIESGNAAACLEKLIEISNR